MTSSVKEYEEYYFKNNVSLNCFVMEQLLWGDHMLKGLLYYSGNEENEIGRNYCFDFLVKLLKYEYNSFEAKKFLEIYGNTDPRIIKEMKIDYYIKRAMTQDNPGLIALHYYLIYTTSDVAFPDYFISDNEVKTYYKQWMEKKFESGYLLKSSPNKKTINTVDKKPKPSPKTDVSEESPSEKIFKNTAENNPSSFEFNQTASCDNHD